MAADHRAKSLEDRLILFQRGRHLVGGDPAIGIKTLGLDFQLFAGRLFHGLLRDSGEDFGVPRTQPHQTLGPQPYVRSARTVRVGQLSRLKRFARFSRFSRFSGFSGFSRFCRFSRF
jgi:hypothetical protein